MTPPLSNQIEDRRPRVGLAWAGNPSAPTTWSGIPAGVLRALADLEVESVAIAAGLSARLEFVAGLLLAAARLHRTARGPVRSRLRAARTAALFTASEMAALRTIAVARNLKRQPAFDGIIQMGSGFTLPHGTPIVTFEDMTVRQALRLPYAQWQALSAREAEARVRAQASLYERARACCFSTSWAAASAVEEYGVDASKVHVVGIGRNHDVAPTARDWSRPRFLFVGGDWERKNGDAVVRAFSRLRRRVGNARLDLVGGHPSLDVEGVHGHGPLSLADPDQRAQLDHLFAVSTCFVMPSVCEPAGIVFVEAAAAGLPAIGSAVGGSAELIGPGGHVVDPFDDNALMAAMLEMADPVRAEALGALASQHSTSFTWRQVAERLMRALSPSGLDVTTFAGVLGDAPHASRG